MKKRLYLNKTNKMSYSHDCDTFEGNKISLITKVYYFVDTPVCLKTHCLNINKLVKSRLYRFFRQSEF